MIKFAEVFDELASPPGASPETIRAAFGAIFAGEWTPVQVAGFAVALRLRGETAPVIRAAAEELRSVMIEVDHGLERVVDTCGTGGDGKGTLNVSTAAALVVAAAGLPVAKHGNRSVSSRAGSADVLEALGVPIDVPVDKQAGILKRANIAFLFAPAHHSAMRHGGVARRELAIRTVFNALGPIANPAKATHQLVGVYDDGLRVILGEALIGLGSRRAFVVRAVDGLDELSPFGPTRVTEAKDGALIERTLGPEDFGLETAKPGAIDGGDATENAARIVGVLKGERDPATGAILMNAAAAIAVGREATGASDLRDAMNEARKALESGAALATLEAWKKAANEAKVG